MPSNTGPSWVLSWRCPGVITTESGRPVPSQARWHWVVSPPRLRPRPSSGGCWTPLFRRPDSADDARHWHAGGRVPSCPSCYRYSPPRRSLRRHPIGSARAPACGPRSHPVPIPSPAGEPIRARLPGSVALGQVTPRRAGAQLPQEAIDDRAMISPLTTASPPTRAQQRRDDAPGFRRQLTASNQLATLSPFASRTRVAHLLRFVRQSLILQPQLSKPSRAFRLHASQA